MSLSRGMRVWSALALCAALVVGAMLWLTRDVLEAGRERLNAERERSAAEARADLEERTRLALWRMDALGSAIMLRESRIPAERYQFPQAIETGPEVLLHFEVRKGGSVSSPDPGANESSGLIADRMARLRSLLAANPLPGDEWDQLREAAIEGESNWLALADEGGFHADAAPLPRREAPAHDMRKKTDYQMHLNVAERAQRGRAVAQAIESRPEPSQVAAPPAAPSAAGRQMQAAQPQEALQAGPMRAVWLGGELFLLREVATIFPQNASRVQGVWFDSRVLQQQLLDAVADLLPHARLGAVDGKAAAEDPLAMVSFPFRLDRNESPGPAAMMIGTVSGIAPLWIAWAAVGLALLAGAALVHGVMRLSERRASFVSAVTHELRTPLTTFRLYSDMLGSGAVKPEKRGDYLKVLSNEADRLSHLVENVLAFSRIERGNARSSVREIAVGDLLESLRERLDARLETAGMRLEMDTTCAARVRADTAAVEHILFNLVDNAAKYAAHGDPPVVGISAAECGRFVEILVRDHGPGITTGECARIFRAFHKSAREAAESQPGVGLGLALSRRLARGLGGGLLCVPTPHGALFKLRLRHV